VRFAESIPAFPARDVVGAADFYRARLGFDVVHAEEGFAILRRDGAEVHLWGASDESWRDRLDVAKPVHSGAESFIAGTASCRVRVEGVDELYVSCQQSGIVHPNGQIGETEWGTREFAVLDPDGNLITFFER
jgi:catechol 2,3-dioxygenase-like lactoylglutathione lyase family enzyme